MADSSTLGERAKRNGGSHGAAGNGAGLGDRLGPLGGAAQAGSEGLARAGAGLVGAGRRFAGEVVGAAARRARAALTADLDDRDPDYIRENLPFSWLWATLWYRAEV